MFYGETVSVEDADRPVRQCIACEEKHVAYISALLEEDRRFTCKELAGDETRASSFESNLKSQSAH